MNWVLNGNSRFEKIVSFLIMVFLTLMLLWQRSHINSMAFEIRQQKDSIENYHLQKLDTYERYESLNKFFKKINEPQHLDLYNNDTILEAHRIIQGFGNKARIFKVEILKDSTVRLTFKVVSINNPMTGVGIDSLYKSQVQMIDRKIWNDFKESFNKIEVYDVIYWNGMLDCFGGELLWEATINNRTYRFGTHCRQAPQFTDACELLMRHVQDKDLQNEFEKQDKRRAEALK